MEKYLIILFLLIILIVLYFCNYTDTIEPLNNTTTNLNADLVESIHNLGKLANDIQKPSGLILPGSLIVTNNADISGNLNVNNNLNVKNNISGNNISGNNISVNKCDISGNLSITNNIDISGNINIYGNIIRKNFNFLDYSSDTTNNLQIKIPLYCSQIIIYFNFNKINNIYLSSTDNIVDGEFITHTSLSIKEYGSYSNTDVADFNINSLIPPKVHICSYPSWNLTGWTFRGNCKIILNKMDISSNMWFLDSICTINSNVRRIQYKSIGTMVISNPYFNLIGEPLLSHNKLYITYN